MPGRPMAFQEDPVEDLMADPVRDREMETVVFKVERSSRFDYVVTSYPLFVSCIVDTDR